uniref:Serine-threonine/tyrosine-protein kinase catalytic domain-containing protein n=1 Tax=Solanum lycopersicum TaxID=4081 RepID=A0A3Q7IHV9_SOLLC
MCVANNIEHDSFGNVYKGVLENGVEITGKKQDVTSHKGYTEFEKEVKLIANVQHCYLTKFLGYCINGEENS